MIGQPKEEATGPNTTEPKQETKAPTRADQSMKGETSETGSRSHYLVQYYEKPRLSQPLQLHVENARLP